jgi:hypothetical protein
MRLVACILFSILAFPAYGDESKQEMDPLEQKLQSVESRTAQLNSGKEKMVKGFMNMEPGLRSIACRAYPVDTERETLQLAKKDIAYLEKKYRTQLSSDQQTRLSAQKELVSKWTYGVDCGALQGTP